MKTVIEKIIKSALTGAQCRPLMLAIGFTWLLCGATATLTAATTTINYLATVRGVTEPVTVSNNIFQAAGPRSAQLALDWALTADQAVTIAVCFKRTGWVRLSTGRGRESVEIGYNDQPTPQMQTRVIAPDGSMAVRKNINFNGSAAANFGWTDQLLEWQSYFDGLAATTPATERWVELALEVRDDFCRFLVDGHLIRQWHVTADLLGRAPQLEVGAGLEVRLPEITLLEPRESRFEMVDVAPRYNASGIGDIPLDATSLPQRGEAFRVGGVPFKLGRTAQGSCDNLDIGMSWFREGNMTSYEAPHRGSFGGRWSGISSANPTRFQFTVPRRPFTAIHLLAASAESPDTVPRVTAQFYRPGAGFPRNFSSPDVPLATASASARPSLLFKGSDGRELRLWLVTIPLEPGLLHEFKDLEIFEVELTKEVQLFRAYPDPNHYSYHAAGLPSAVRLFAMTLEAAPVTVSFEPEALANVWVAPATPAWLVEVANDTPEATEVELLLQSVSYDKSETNSVRQLLPLAAHQARETRFQVPLNRYGHHDVTLQVTAGKTTQLFTRSLSHLRRRENQARPYDAPGFMFGYWNWRGGHHTPGELQELELMGKLGMESTGPNGGSIATEQATMAMARRYGIRSFWAGGRWAAAIGYDDDPDTALANLRREWRAWGDPKTTPTHQPVYVNIFAEPGGIGTEGVLPEFYGEPPFEMNEAQRKVFQQRHATALASARVAREWNPDIKLLIPWGDPSFAIPYLQANDELSSLIDGIGVDIGYFDRMPEMQMHQCAIHRTYQFTHYWKQYKKQPPVWPTVEGPCIGPVMDGSLTPEQHAANFVRSALILAAYGINRQFAMGAPADCAGWWGEQHYGGGMIGRYDTLNPHPTYSAVGTLVRNLRHMEFVGWEPTGSLSVYALRFRDSRNDSSLHALWTLRGKREIQLALPKGKRLELYDSMDNQQRLTATEEGVTLTLTTQPCFLYEVGDSFEVAALGDPDHSDSLPGEHVVTLGTIADLFATQGDDADPEYVESFPVAVRRFPAVMELERVAAPAAQGGSALAITLPPQPKDRGVMPFYTALKPQKPVVIPGKGRHLSLWVRAASDWGRVVYVLRDAKGERWTSVGSVGEWNSDDTPAASFFNFDGWRLVRFELPSHAPYDTFREAGTTWWGSAAGDGIVDLPLAIEKIFIERRPKAMYVNSLEATDPAPVLLGELLVEYASESEMGVEVVLASRVRMSPPPVDAPRSNPIEMLAAGGTLPATTITAVEHPAHYYDGTRGIFHFNEVEDATHYDIWLSRTPDGTGALKLGNKLKGSGLQVNGFRAGTDFYAFVVYSNKGGASSRPSSPFKFNLDNQFGMR